ncbi:MAG: hypothetical protein IJ660_05555 [Alphaproteobacteria bacterium]|nr:hypothetical protein [Alphaproteobacteria bacterium]
MGKKSKAKSESGTKVITTSPKQEAATVKILGLASEYGVTIFKAPRMEDGHLTDGQRAVRKEFPSGDPQKPDVLYSMWANKKDGERVLAVLKPQENALSIKPATAAIRTVKF